DFDQVEVIEVLVNEGDTIAAEQSLITVESDKASMEIPSPAAGIVKRLLVKLGDKVSEGTRILGLQVQDAGQAEAPAPQAAGRAPQPEAAPQAPSGQEIVPPAEPSETAQAKTGLPESAPSMTPPATAPVAGARVQEPPQATLSGQTDLDRKSTRLNSSHVKISYAVFCLKKKTTKRRKNGRPLLTPSNRNRTRPSDCFCR